MQAASAPHPAIDLSPALYYQLVHTLTKLLPPPLDDSPDALRAQNHAAIAKVAALRPVNANEADLAAHCIAARAQAEDVMRLLRQHAGDIALTIRLNAQYTSMVRTSLSVEARLMRVQAVRQKREAIEATATEDAWTQHIADQSMLKAVDPGVERRTAGTTGTIVSHHDTNSHDVAFETRMSDPVLNQEADPSVPPIAQANAEIAAGKAVAKPNPPHPVAPVQAAPAKQASPLGAPLAAPLAAVKAKPHPGAQPIRPANPRDGLLWADAMSVVADEMIAGLSALPPALRKQEAMRARLLRSTAMEITARAGRAPTPRQTVPLPKT